VSGERGVGATPGGVDVVILGGGVCGLLLRAVLWKAGYSTVLVSKGPLGAGQTIGSQGILHAGLKYAADGVSREISGTLAESRGWWRGALTAGDGIDLRRVRVLAERTHFWTPGGAIDRLVGTAAAAVMKAGARRLERGEFPAVFRPGNDAVAVWEVEEEAVDAASLISVLRDAPGGEIVAVESEPSVETDAAGVRLAGVGERRIVARHAVLAAGAGNETLLAKLGVAAERVSQRRPLHMLYAGGTPDPLFGHCLQLSDKPRLTITSGKSKGDGGWVWYVGGEVAERGVERNAMEQIAAGRAELRSAMPWLDVGALTWGTVLIDRAEGRTAAGGRPDGPVIHRGERFTAVWPTKLAMAPAAVKMVAREISGALGGGSGTRVEPVDNSRVGVAPVPWERANLDATGGAEGSGNRMEAGGPC